MTDEQWSALLGIIKGERSQQLPVGFIIDSPWLPNWAGMKILDYYSSDDLWFSANLKAMTQFPDAIFLPGFWSEYGMCTEPSAFGARCSFPANEFPHPHKVIDSVDDIRNLTIPDPRTDGLLPFVLNRLKLAEPKIKAAGHSIKFAVARGPLNIASYLMGLTEFMLIMMEQPDETKILLSKVTSFLKDWLRVQMETFPSIDGVFLLDDIIGFVGEREFRNFGLPYLKDLFDVDVAVRFFHNDAACRVSAPFLLEMGVNLFNMGFDISLNELKSLTQNKITLLGNIPPRDTLAGGTVEEVRETTLSLLNNVEEESRVIFSCGGGMPPEVSTTNLNAFIETVRNFR